MAYSHPVSGDRLDGVYQAQVTLNSAAEAGVWHVQYLLLNDEAGNITWLSPANSADLAALSFSVGDVASVVSLSAITDSGASDLNAGHVITISLAMSETVYVAGTPSFNSTTTR